MKLTFFILFVFTGHIVCAQPEWSPKVRAQRENTWFRDSLHVQDQILQKVYRISLNYYTEMDKEMGNSEAQSKLMHEKDKKVSCLLSKQQYSRYYQREKRIRLQVVTKYQGAIQPY